jgi:Htaa
MAETPRRVTLLSWGVKQSFCTYVQSAGGVIETGAGTQRNADGEFTFAAAPDSDLCIDADGKLQGQGKFVGHVKFTAHGGMLSVFLANPILEVSETGATLTVTDHETHPRQVELAKLTLEDMTTVETGELMIPTKLAMFGIQLLGDHYPLNTALDSVRLSGNSA